MPRFDGTGPCGQGSKTGRGLGDCQAEDASGYPKRMGQGYRCDHSMGRRCRYQTNMETTPMPNPEQLQRRVQELKNELAFPEKKLTSLE